MWTCLCKVLCEQRGQIFVVISVQASTPAGKVRKMSKLQEVSFKLNRVYENVWPDTSNINLIKAF